MSANTCGGCTQCCKTMKVDAIAKPEHEWCSACHVGVGCRRYEDRPQACAEFECLWLQSQRQPGAAMPASMRPDRSKVVLGLSRTKLRAGSDAALHLGGERQAIVVHVDRDRPAATQAREVRAFVERMVANGVPVAIVCGDERRFLDVAGSVPYVRSDEEAPGC